MVLASAIYSTLCQMLKQQEFSMVCAWEEELQANGNVGYFNGNSNAPFGCKNNTAYWERERKGKGPD